MRGLLRAPLLRLTDIPRSRIIMDGTLYMEEAHFGKAKPNEGKGRNTDVRLHPQLLLYRGSYPTPF